jgi:hypothetical protein
VDDTNILVAVSYLEPENYTISLQKLNCDKNNTGNIATSIATTSSTLQAREF